MAAHRPSPLPSSGLNRRPGARAREDRRDDSRPRLGTRPSAGPPEAPRPARERRGTRTPIPLDGLDRVAPKPGRGTSRRISTTACFLMILAGMLVFARFVNTPGVVTAGSAPATARPVTTATKPKIGTGTDSSDAAVTPAGTSGHFAYVKGYGPVLGRRGTVQRFRVAVEKPEGPDAGAGFADEVNRILGDPRGWVANGHVRFQRVPHSAHAAFTIYLSSAGTSERMCSAGGLDTGGYTSCHIPRQVIINVVRWQHAVKGYAAPIGVYRAYAINHEVGHQLGHGHEVCPGRGRPAPVMMQQTYGLKGCVANSWPYLGGKRYTGPPAP